MTTLIHPQHTTHYVHDHPSHLRTHLPARCTHHPACCSQLRVKHPHTLPKRSHFHTGYVSTTDHARGASFTLAHFECHHHHARGAPTTLTHTECHHHHHARGAHFTHTRGGSRHDFRQFPHNSYYYTCYIFTSGANLPSIAKSDRSCAYSYYLTRHYGIYHYHLLSNTYIKTTIKP